MRSKWFVLLLAAVATASLWGCGSSGGSGGSDVPGGGDGSTLASVGSSVCLGCHDTLKLTQEGWYGSEHDVQVAGCEGCHGDGQYHQAGNGKPMIPVQYPDLDTCANCHDVTARHINGDDPATSYQTTPANPVVEGYTKVEDCLGCHSAKLSTTTQWQHNPTGLEINTAWASSAHAGHITSATPDTGSVWGHYDWDASNRASCARCHTATGAMNFLNAPASYVAANNDFSHLSGWTPAVSSQQNELLYCWGCHSDVRTGALRNPGAITEVYPGVGTAAPATTVVYPNVTESNTCMGCHLGRQIGDNIATSTANFANQSFINSHYLAAGGMIFNESGYEYTASDDLGFHKEVGVANAFNTGTAGPCVSCHMSEGSGHTFEFLTKDGAGVITANNSSMCNNCHLNVAPAALETAKENLHLALEELRLALEARGVYFLEAYPYFFTTPAGGGANGFKDWTIGGTMVGKDVMGAAFNYNLIEHDPGAYAHNNDYALKLIADSVDFLGDGLVNGTASVASSLIGLGMNLDSGAGYSPIHDAPVDNALASYATADVTCSQCHSKAPHYISVPTAIATSGRPGTAQYVNPNGTCADCHYTNDPATNPDILVQYAATAHATNNGSAWRGSCGPCHDPELFINAINPGTIVTPNSTKKVLSCNACHTSLDPASATRRVAAARTTIWSANSITANMVFPDAGDSNLCITCHSARRAGANLSATGTTTAHYAPAAIVVFGGTADQVTVLTSSGGVPAVDTKYTGGGYEFAGQDYTLGFIDHKNIGIANYDGTGNAGPCVTCHMGGTAEHTWNAVTKNETTGEVVIVNSDVCATCHGGTITPAFLNSRKADFAAALANLEAQLNARGISYDHGSFVFSGGLTYTTAAALAPVVFQRDLMGAAFNFWLFSYERADQAGYVHNPDYALQLINDSTDLLNDGLINGNF